MVKKQVFSISIIILLLSLVWCIQSVSASTYKQELETVTPTPTTMSENEMIQISSFGNSEMEQIFTTGNKSNYIISLDNKFQVFAISPMEFLENYDLNEEYDNSILSVNFDGELVALKANSGFYIYNTNNRIKSNTYESSSEGYSFYSFMPTGKAFLYGVHHPATSGSYTELLIRGVDENNNVLGRNLQAPSDALTYYSYASPIISPDGNYIVAGYTDAESQRILVWSLDASDVLYEITSIPAAINTLAISPDSETMVSGGEDGIVRVWDLETGAFIENISGFNSPVSSIQYDEKGTTLSISTSNRYLYTYNFVSKQLKQLTKSEETELPLLVVQVEGGFILKSAGNNESTPPPASLVFSPDGSKIALIEGSVQIWEVEGKLLENSFLPDNRFHITNATFDNSGDRLAILNDQGEVYIWNIATNKTELHIPYQKMLENQEPFTSNNVSTAVDNDLSDFSNQNIVFSPDGQQIAFANGMNIEIWNIVLAAKNKTLSADGMLGRPEKLVFSEDGEAITAVFNKDRSFVTWNIRNGEIIDQFEITHDAIMHGEFTNLYSDYFVTLNNGSSNSWIDLWNLTTKESVKLDILDNSLLSSAFNPTASLFAAIDNSNTLYIWRTDTGQLLHYENGFPTNSSLAINPSGTILTTSENGQITFWDLAPITEKGFQENFVSPTLMPAEQNDGFTFNTVPTATPTFSSQTIIEQQSETEITLETESTQDAIDTAQEINENPEPEPSLLKAQKNQGIVTSIDWQNNKLYLSSTTGLYSYDIAKEEFAILFTNEEMDISSIEGISNTNYLAAGIANKNQIQLWNPNKAEQLLLATGFDTPEISPNKKLMAYYLNNSRYILWNIGEEQSKFILTGTEPSAPIAFSPDSKYLAIAQNTGLVQVWDTSKGTIEYAFNGGNIPCTHIQFSSDGKSIMGITSGSVWLWPLANDNPPVTIEVYASQGTNEESFQNHYVTAAEINYNNEIIAIADDTGTIRFYTLADQNLYRNMSQPKYEITQLAFSSTNNQLATVDINGNISIWDANSSELINELEFFNGTIDGLRTLDNGYIAAWTKNAVIFYDPETLEIQNDIMVDNGKIFNVSPNGKWAAVNTTNAIELIDLSTGEKITALATSTNNIDEPMFNGAVFSNNNEYLINYGTDGAWVYKLNQTDISKTSLLGDIEAAQIHLAAFNNDGSRFILSSGEGYLRPKVYETTKQTGLIDIALAEYQTNLISGQEYSAYTFLPDNEQAVLLRSGLYDDARLEVADLSTGSNLAFITYENTKANALAINPDGSRIAVGFDTGEIRIYATENLTLLDEYNAHPASVSHLAISKDGAYLISIGEEGSIKSWIME